MSTYEFKLPDMGEGVIEGEIVKWLVNEGDTVSEDQGLVEVMTDKATVTVPSPRGGKVLKRFGNEGDIAKVHQTLMTLDTDAGTEADAKPNLSPAVNPQVVPTRSDPSRNSKVLATPVTRKIAHEHGLDLSDLEGTGPQGRVTKTDVMAALSSTPSGTRVPELPSVPFSAAGDQRIPLRGLRRKIADKMVRSKFTAPHYTFVEEVDVTELVALRKRINQTLAETPAATKISFLPFICKALVRTFKKFPLLNANFDEATQELIVRSNYNFGIAVSTDEGLTVPVISGVDKLSLEELARQVQRLGRAAKDKSLKREDLIGGTFTITSLGQKGGLFATPIINHPEVAILGVHRIQKCPVVRGDEIVVREMMHLSLSLDHRVIDGAVGAEFTYGLIRYLAHPENLFLELV